MQVFFCDRLKSSLTDISMLYIQYILLKLKGVLLGALQSIELPPNCRKNGHIDALFPVVANSSAQLRP